MSAREAFGGRNRVRAWPLGTIAVIERSSHVWLDGHVTRYFPSVRLVAKHEGETYSRTITINEMPGGGSLDAFHDFAARIVLAIRIELARDERRSHR